MEEELKNPDHNLATQVKTKNSWFSGRSISPFVFDALSLISAFGFGFVYRRVVDGISPVPLLLVLLGIYLVSSVFANLLTKGFSKRAGFIVLEIALVLFSFFTWPILNQAIAGLVAVLFLLWGFALERRELRNNVEVSFVKTIRPYLAKALTGLTFLVLILYMPKWTESSSFFGETTFNSFFSSASGMVGKLYPEINISPTSTVRQVAESLAISKLERNQFFNDLPPDTRKAAVKEATNQIMDSFMKSFGVGVNENDTTSKFFYSFVTNKLSGMKERTGNLFVIMWAIVMFFLIRGIGAIVSLIAVVISYIVYEVLIALKVFRIGGENRLVETLEFA